MMRTKTNLPTGPFATFLLIFWASLCFAAPEVQVFWKGGEHAKNVNYNCYEVFNSNSGFHDMANPSLVILDKACELSNVVTIEIPMSPFKVVSNDLFPILANINENAGFKNGHLQAKEEIAAMYGHYLIISKEHHLNGQIWFKVFLQLPDISPYKDLTEMELNAIQSSVEDLMNQGFVLSGIYGSSFNSELKGIELLKNIIDSINNGTFSVSDEMFESSGWEVLPLDPNDSPSYGSAQLNTDPLLMPRVYDFSGIRLSGSYLAATLKGLDEFILPGLIDESYAFILTGENNSSDDIKAAEEYFNFENYQSEKMIVWMHFVLEPSEGFPDGKMRIQSSDQFTDFELEEILDKLWIDHITRWVNIESYPDGPLNVFKENEVLNRSLECEWTWQFGKKCMLPEWKNLVSAPNPLLSQGAMAIGLLDGLLGSVEFMYKAGGGVASGIGSIFKGIGTYVKDLGVAVARQRSMKAAFEKVSSDISESWKIIKEKVVKLYEFAVAATKQLANNAGEIVNSIIEGLIHWLGELITGEPEPAYDIGVLAFDLVVTAFTGGTGGAGKLLPKLTKALESMKGNMGNGITALLHEAGEKASTFATGAKKFFHCKILMKGCFVKDTPVLMASKSHQFSFKNAGKVMAFAAAMPIVAVPIQEVQLLDYAVAHKTVNAGYGLTANVELYSSDQNTRNDFYLGLTDQDSYTSDQQRKRDQYELDDKNWNEVVFEEVGGFSTTKLALHNNWIKENGYHQGAVVNMNLPEQGISGPFRITSIKHILPQKKPIDEDSSDDYDYKPVTALFTHVSNQVYNIDFDNGESLGVTYRHPIYSVTEGDWKLAGELKVGEKVLAKSGEATVVKLEKREGAETVYNLEVKELHNFLVGENGVVVHNFYLLKNCLVNLIKYLGTKAKYVLNGTGKWNQVGGHHPLAKKAFEGNTTYKWRHAFSVSKETLGGQSVHNAITGSQNSLYSAWKAANPTKPMSLDDMVKIEINAMTVNGIPEDVATGWVVKALEDLKSQGVDKLINIPWNGVNP